jgi:hypothetical protein
MRMRIGRWLNYFVAPARQADELKYISYVRNARSPGDRLTPHEVADMTAHQISHEDLDTRRQYHRDYPIERTFQGLAAPLVEEVLRTDPDVRSVLNIGANYAYVDHWMAERHPDVLFQGVDFPPNLPEYNAEFARPNLKIHSGYAIEMLERGEIKADVVYFSSTATCIKNREIREYLVSLFKTARYVIFNEPLFNLPGDGIIDPTTVDPHDSVPSHIPQSAALATGKAAPACYLCYTHNYKAIAEQCGFQVVHYRAYRPEFTDLRWLQMVAKNPSPPAAMRRAA